MNALLDFFTHEAGQKRRAWLDRQDAKVGNALRYYLGPTGVDKKLNALAGLMQFTDAGDYQEAADASRALWSDPNFNNAARYGTAAVAMMLPGISARLANTGSNVLADAGASLADDARRFVGDEYGGIRAYHGSPHDFDKFSMDKIGTGEGAQAYGHGLYFAEAEDVADSYRGALAPGMGKDALRDAGISETHLRALDQFTKNGVDPDIAYRDWLGWTGLRDHDSMKQAFMSEWAQRNDGRMYEVNINADPADFLDWDAPLSEQSGTIQSAWRAFKDSPQGKYADEGMNGDILGGEGSFANPTGKDFLGAYSEATPHNPNDMFDYSRNFQRDLNSQGIPGIKYKDAMSRGAEGGTRNYVVFDENLIEIVRKYGVAGAATALGMSVSDVEAAVRQEQQKAEISNYLAEVGR